MAIINLRNKVAITDFTIYLLFAIGSSYMVEVACFGVLYNFFLLEGSVFITIAQLLAKSSIC